MRWIMLTRNRFCLLLVGLIIVCWATPLWAIDLEKKVAKAKLDNGLTVLMLERNSVRQFRSISATASEQSMKSRDKAVLRTFWNI